MADSSDQRKNAVRFGRYSNKFVLADVVRHLLNDGEKEVTLSAFNECISNAVFVAQLLRAQGFVQIIRIETSRQPQRGCRIVITVVRANGFEKEYSAYLEDRKTRKVNKDSH